MPFHSDIHHSFTPRDAVNGARAAAVLVAIMAGRVFRKRPAR